MVNSKKFTFEEISMLVTFHISIKASVSIVSSMFKITIMFCLC